MVVSSLGFLLTMVVGSVGFLLTMVDSSVGFLFGVTYPLTTCLDSGSR
jgi:hypothetical protein